MRHRPAFETVGGYAIYEEFAAGGMATVHFGRPLGPGGPRQVVAVKRMYPHFTRDPDFLTMFTDEARLAALIRHPNVVPVLDVVSEGGELSMVMSFVVGESLGKLLRSCRDARRRVPARIAAAIIVDALHGLHAAHEAVGEHGEPLGIVHRDVSPQNVLVGADGVGRVLDFGVATARGRMQTTREGQLKGKLSYMAPEQLDSGDVDRRADIFPAGSILWEMLVGRRLFDGASEAAIIRQLLDPEVSPPSRYAREHIHFDEVIAHALDPDPARRYPTAAAMAADIEDRVTPAPASEVAAWAMDLAGNAIERRALRAARIEAAPTVEDAALPARPDAVPQDGFTVDSGAPPALAEGSRTLEMSQIYFDAAHAPPS
ncbi:MAG: protein kinase [Polyangiaceae bacterium]